MAIKRVVLLAMVVALAAAASGCGWRRSCCRTSELPCEPDSRYYQSRW
jgi:hypothetical protein